MTYAQMVIEDAYAMVERLWDDGLVVCEEPDIDENLVMEFSLAKWYSIDRFEDELAEEFCYMLSDWMKVQKVSDNVRVYQSRFNDFKIVVHF